MTRDHWLVLVIVLIGFFTQTAGLDHWGDVLNPKFLSGTMLIVLGLLRTMLLERIGGRRAEVWSDSQRAAHRGDLGV